jgi:hypothetical protein
MAAFVGQHRSLTPTSPNDILILFLFGVSCTVTPALFRSLRDASVDRLYSS